MENTKELAIRIYNLAKKSYLEKYQNVGQNAKINLLSYLSAVCHILCQTWYEHQSNVVSTTNRNMESEPNLNSQEETNNRVF